MRVGNIASYVLWQGCRTMHGAYAFAAVLDVLATRATTGGPVFICD